MGGLSPSHLPRTPLHECAAETALLQREIHVVGHEHLSGVGDHDRFLKYLFEPPPCMDHGFLESDDVEIQKPGVVGLNAHHLDVGAGAKLLEGIEHPWSPTFSLGEK